MDRHWQEGQEIVSSAFCLCSQLWNTFCLGSITPGVGSPFLWEMLPTASSAANLLLLLCHLNHPTPVIIILSEIRPPQMHKLNLRVTTAGPANSNTLPSSPCPSFGGTSGRCSLRHCLPMGLSPVIRMAQPVLGICRFQMSAGPWLQLSFLRNPFWPLCVWCMVISSLTGHSLQVDPVLFSLEHLPPPGFSGPFV